MAVLGFTGESNGPTDDFWVLSDGDLLIMTFNSCTHYFQAMAYIVTLKNVRLNNEKGSYNAYPWTGEAAQLGELLPSMQEARG